MPPVKSAFIKLKLGFSRRAETVQTTETRDRKQGRKEETTWEKEGGGERGKAGGRKTER